MTLYELDSYTCFILLAMIGFEILKLIVRRNVEVTLEIKQDIAKPWLLIYQEFPEFTSSKEPMEKFWDMHIDELKAEAVKRGLPIKNKLKAVLISELVEMCR